MGNCQWSDIIHLTELYVSAREDIDITFVTLMRQQNTFIIISKNAYFIVNYDTAWVSTKFTI